MYILAVYIVKFHVYTKKKEETRENAKWGIGLTFLLKEYVPNLRIYSPLGTFSAKFVSKVSSVIKN